MNMAYIYLDNSATTKPHPQVIALTGRVMSEQFGNPSSLHELGVAAEKLLKEARRRTAALFTGNDKEIIFTSGGTEANNLAIIGTALGRRSRGKHLITSQVEHPSVLNCFRYLEKEKGYRVDYLPVNRQGYVDPFQLEKLVTKNTVLVSIMHVNNETGTIQPLEIIGPLLKSLNRNTVFHVDAVQSLGKIPLYPVKWKTDLVSCSAHKLHGPRGAGCLWKKNSITLYPLMHGGGQEHGLRPGTENVAAIAGFGLAVKMAGENMSKNSKLIARLKETFYNYIQHSNLNCHLNGPDPGESAAHIINISFPGLPAEVLLHSLEEKGVYASAGSACHSRKPDPSHTLRALGLEDRLLTSALRFSFSCYNSEQEVLAAAETVAGTVNNLKKIIKA